MRFYADYLSFLQERDLMLPSLERAIMPWTAQFFCHLFDCGRFDRVLEIGRSRGHSFGLFRWLSPKSLVVSVDPVVDETAQKIADLFEGPYQFINKTSDKAFADGVGRGFDLILIDGNHKLEFARRDWRNALKVASPGAVVVFDNLFHKQGCGRAFFEIEIGGPVVRKLEQCGDHRTWPKAFKGAFGVVMLG